MGTAKANLDKMTPSSMESCKHLSTWAKTCRPSRSRTTSMTLPRSSSMLIVAIGDRKAVLLVISALDEWATISLDSQLFCSCLDTEEPIFVLLWAGIAGCWVGTCQTLGWVYSFNRNLAEWTEAIQTKGTLWAEACIQLHDILQAQCVPIRDFLLDLLYAMRLLLPQVHYFAST